MIRTLFIAGLTAALAGLSAWQAAGAWSRSLPADAVPGWLANAPQHRLAKTERWLTDPEALARNEAAIVTDAQAVLQDAPLNAVALRQMALARSARDGGGNDQLLDLASRITRRDLVTNLLLIDKAALEGGRDRSLSLYDRTLTIFPDVSPQLFPLLVAAAGDAEVLKELSGYAARPWFGRFLTQALALGAATTDVTALATASKSRLDRERYTALVSQLLRQLVSRGDYREARQLAAQLDGYDTAAFDQLGLSQATTDPRAAPLSWVLRSDDAVAVTLGEDQALDIVVEPEQTGLAAERVTLLRAGAYDVLQTLTYTEGEAPARLTWQVTCLGRTAVDIWSQPLPVQQRKTTYQAHLTIPEGCEAQRWRLMAWAIDGQQPAHVRLTGLSLQAR